MTTDQQRVAVVTGAARGIGAAILRTLARDGATVIGVDLPAAGEDLMRLVNELGGTTLADVLTALETAWAVRSGATTASVIVEQAI